MCGPTKEMYSSYKFGQATVIVHVRLRVLKPNQPAF